MVKNRKSKAAPVIEQAEKVLSELRAHVGAHPMASGREVLARLGAHLRAQSATSGVEVQVLARHKKQLAAAEADVTQAQEVLAAHERDLEATTTELSEARAAVAAIDRKDAVTEADVVAAENARRRVTRLKAKLGSHPAKVASARRDIESARAVHDSVQRQFARRRVQADCARIIARIQEMNAELQAAFDAHDGLLGEASESRENGSIVSPETLVSFTSGGTAVEKAAKILRQNFVVDGANRQYQEIEASWKARSGREAADPPADSEALSDEEMREVLAEDRIERADRDAAEREEQAERVKTMTDEQRRRFEAAQARQSKLDRQMGLE